MAPALDVAPPRGDSDYFGRISKAIFTAGLNWRVVDNKWPNFGKAFSKFSPERVAKFSDNDVGRLMKNTGIVRNEKKIRATIQNAKTILEIRAQHGSFKGFVDSFGKREVDLLSELQTRFSHVGPSTARTFLWMVGYPLTPTKEERIWMKGHKGH